MPKEKVSSKSLNIFFKGWILQCNTGRGWTWGDKGDLCPVEDMRNQ